MHYSPPASLPESRNLIELILSFLITIALQEDQGENLQVSILHSCFNICSLHWNLELLEIWRNERKMQ